MKMSLKLMIYANLAKRSCVKPVACCLTFSCFRCFRSFNSRYVRFERTGVLNGFMIFFTATACPVSWSFAELDTVKILSCGLQDRLSYQTSPNAPIPTGCRPVYLSAVQYVFSRRLIVTASPIVPARNLERRAKDLRAHELRHLDRVMR